MSPKIVNTGLSEFIEQSVKSTAADMPWMKDKVFRLCETMDELHSFVDDAIKAGYCSLDLETTGLNSRVRYGKPVCRIVSFCMSHDGKLGMYVPVGHQEDKDLNLPEKEAFAEISRLILNCVTIYHHAKFDHTFLANYGMPVPDYDRFEDTLILARLYDSGQKDIRLKHLSGHFLNQPMIEFEDISKSGRIDLVSPKIAYIYGASDAVCTYDLYKFFSSSDIIKIQKAIYNLEKRVVPIVRWMESSLLKIDAPYLEALKKTCEERLKVIEKEVYHLAGREFNIGSTQQLGQLLFDELKYRYPNKEKTASGQYKTDTDTLEKMAEDYPIVKLLVEYRGLEKSHGTYISNLLANRDENDCIKLGFNQSGTDTGRFSSPGGEGIDFDGYCGINVQSLPANYDPTVPDLRRAFIARTGYKMVAMDYSGEELRVAANLSKEPKWVDEFLHGDADLHTATGRAIFGRQEITKNERKLSKCVAKGTLIASERGWIPIEDLKVGDKVVTHTGALKPISKTWVMGKKEAIKITTRTSHIVKCGVNHRFMAVDGSWVRAEDLHVGDKIQTMSCDPIRRGDTEVVSIKRLKDVELLDLSVSDDHTYIANGLITHNTVNFLMLYGGGPRGLAQQAKIPEAEAKRTIAAFFKGLPVLKKWIDGVVARARKAKCVSTSFGRVRPLEFYYNSGDKGMEAHADRCATNTQIQGSCADIMKTAMVRVYNWIMSNGLQNDIRMLITMHDELVYEIREDKLSEYIPQLNKIMILEDILQGILKWPVPLALDAEYGDSWHVDKDFFKEHPELLKTEAINFGQAESRVVINPDSPPTVKDAVPVAPQEVVSEPVSETPIAGEPEPIQLLTEQTEPTKSDGPVQDIVQNAVQEPVSQELDTFIYTIKDRKKSTARLLNQIMLFLDQEKEAKINYLTKPKSLILRDPDGNSLLVSEVRVHPDAFLAVARYVGL